MTLSRSTYQVSPATQRRFVLLVSISYTIGYAVIMAEMLRVYTDLGPDPVIPFVEVSTQVLLLPLVVALCVYLFNVHKLNTKPLLFESIMLAGLATVAAGLIGAVFHYLPFWPFTMTVQQTWQGWFLDLDNVVVAFIAVVAVLIKLKQKSHSSVVAKDGSYLLRERAQTVIAAVLIAACAFDAISLFTTIAEQYPANRNLSGFYTQIALVVVTGITAVTVYGMNIRGDHTRRRRIFEAAAVTAIAVTVTNSLSALSWPAALLFHLNQTGYTVDFFSAIIPYIAMLIILVAVLNRSLVARRKIHHSR